MGERVKLEDWGWDAAWEGLLAGARQVPARVVRQERDQFILMSEEGPLRGVISGSFLKDQERPVTGDWVSWSAIEGDDKVLIDGLLPRRSELARQGAGEKTVKQVIAANVDWVLILVGLDNDFNMRRLERYLRVISGRNVNAVILLNKIDLVADLDAAMADVKAVAGDVPILPISARDRMGLEALGTYVRPGETLVCVGSSGVGKSTLINALLGEERLATFEVREGDDRGRHTTTQRELVRLPSGALMIDTPGIRELSEWQEEAEDETEDMAFGDIEELALECKFRDCGHKNEPGCAVREALEGGTLDLDRYQSYLKLEEERAQQAKRQEEAERLKKRKVQGRSRRIQTPKKR